MERDQIYAYISHHKLSFCCACCPCLGNLSSSSSLSLNLWRTREKEGSVQCDCADVQSSLTPWQRWVPILSKCRAALRLFPPSLSFDSSLPSYKLLQTHQRVTLLHRQYHMHFSNFKFYTVAKSTRLQSFSTANTLFITLEARHSTCVNSWHARSTVGRSANLRLAVHVRRKREAILAVLEVHHAHVVNGLQVCFQVAWPVEKLATNITLKSAIEGLVHQHVAPHAVLGWVRLEADRARVVGPSCRQERRALSRRWRLQLLEVRVVLAEKVVHTWHLIIGSDCATTWGLLVGSRKRRKKGNMEEAIYLHHFRKRRERSIFTEPSVCT